MPGALRVSAAAVRPRRGQRVPLRALGRRLDDGDVARRLQMARAEGDRVGADRGGDLIDEGPSCVFRFGASRIVSSSKASAGSVSGPAAFAPIGAMLGCALRDIAFGAA